MREIPLASIKASQFQPRKRFDEEALAALVDSIKAVGILQPVLLREADGEGYELIAGERRCRAARRAGLQTVPALVQVANDVASLEQALVENLHREDLNALDEAAAYKQLIEDFNLTHDEVSRRVGRSRTAVTNALRLLQLPPSVQRLVQEGAVSPGHARALLMTPDRELQEELAVVTIEDGLSVRALEDLVRTRSEERAAALDLGAEPSGRGEGLFSRPVLRSRPLRPPGVLELEELLAAHLNTRVRVDMRSKRGRVVIEFATLEDLERIYRVMIGEPSS
jgi:ParB family chromosome partitioning protein